MVENSMPFTVHLVTWIAELSFRTWAHAEVRYMMIMSPSLVRMGQSANTHCSSFFKGLYKTTLSRSLSLSLSGKYISFWTGAVLFFGFPGEVMRFPW